MSRLRTWFLCAFAVACGAISCKASDRILLSRLGPTQANLFISNADGTGEHSLAQSGSLDYDPSWSPQGDWIAFTSERAGSADLYRIHPDGTGIERLTDDPAYDDQAAFSPDGKRLVFVSTRAGGRANLWILDGATHKAKALTSGNGGDFRPSWSPDGQWIAFSSDRDSSLPDAKGRWERLHLVDIYLIRSDGSGLKRISQHGDFCGSPKWTSDSKSIVAYCMSAQETWDFRFGEGNGDDKLLKIDVASGVRPLCRQDPESSSSHRCCPRVRLRICAATRLRTGSFMGAVSRGLQERICVVRRGRPMERRLYSAATS